MIHLKSLLVKRNAVYAWNHKFRDYDLCFTIVSKETLRLFPPQVQRLSCTHCDHGLHNSTGTGINAIADFGHD